ncbi:hypothetical protein FRAHR75_220006 [Frankia sp. Hr75.2]|nr:hypothetical protein FRAHR75_220006 [Frankia sp. Hr75.2]
MGCATRPGPLPAEGGQLSGRRLSGRCPCGSHPFGWLLGIGRDWPVRVRSLVVGLLVVGSLVVRLVGRRPTGGRRQCGPDPAADGRGAVSGAECIRGGEV